MPTVYLAACCWESRLIVNPAITTQIMLGVILIVTMAARPNGLLGSDASRWCDGGRPLLELDKLSLAFGGLNALTELDLQRRRERDRQRHRTERRRQDDSSST